MKFKWPKVSVIVVNFNGKKYIGECVDSILQSDYSSFEVIIVENGSSDGSWQYLSRRYGKNSKVRLVRSEINLFFSGGSNLGASEAKGQKLVFINSDARVDKNCLKELVLAVGKERRRLVQPKIMIDGKKRVIDNVGGVYRWPGVGFGKGSLEIDRGQYDEKRQIDFVNGTCFLIDKNFFEDLGGFDESFRFLYEDVDLNLRAKRKGGESWLSYKAVIWHKGGLSFRKNWKDEKIIYYSRRNRLLTTIKNFKGFEKWGRVLGLIVSYVFLPRRLVSLKALLAVAS